MENTIETTAHSEESQVGRREELTREHERFATPPVDIYENDDGLVVLADLPGIKPEGLSISVEEGILTIEGKYTREGEEIYLDREFELTSFFRQFQLTEIVDTENIKAVLKNGVLNLSLPKSEKAKPRQIPIDT